MALSFKLGKLDAICAKLKSSQDPQPPPDPDASLPSTTDGQESNNNNKSLVDYNDVSTLSPSASSSRVASPRNNEERSDFCANEDSMPLPGRSNNRRKSRKAAKPRNINTYQETYVRYDVRDEELMDCLPDSEHDRLSIHQDDADEDLGCFANQMAGLDESLSSDVEASSNNLSGNCAGESESSHVKEDEETEGFPLDLSCPGGGKKVEDVRRDKAPRRVISDRDVMGNCEPEGPELNSTAEPHLLLPESLPAADSVPNHPSSSGGLTESNEAQVLADYAKNTVNELLSIYGFGSNAEALTRNISLQNFSPGQKAATAHRALQVKEENNVPYAEASKVNGSLEGSNEKDIFAAGSFLESKPLALTNGAPKTEMTKPFEFSKFKLSTHHGPSMSKLLPDYSKYLKRYSSSEQCGGPHCRDLGYRDHYHCMDCTSKVFLKKEEMVRHFKWHKKRDDSLQHGFLRYSSSDSCSDKFPTCTHNARQTHYHCIQSGCDKVYISTSDVQMHANYHRKDSAIIMEGFQRFRATEDCGTTNCQFYGHRTTHFHCRRSGCNFTFKNKADMEKHKSYHQKDEILGRDGFKKFMKYEHCSFKGCRFSKISNHIHCIRPGCTYVLHSTAQLYSHKRKHERRDFENAYRNFRQAQQHKPSVPGATPQHTPSPMKAAAPPSLASSASLGGMRPMSLPVTIQPDPSALTPSQSGANATPSPARGTPRPPLLNQNGLPQQVPEDKGESAYSLTSKASELTGEKLNDSLSLPIPLYAQSSTGPESTTSTTSAALVDASRVSAGERREKDEFWKNYLTRYTANDPCHSRCHFLYKDHYHCKMEGCPVFFKSKDGVREHAKYHELQDRITPMVYVSYEATDACPFDCEFNLKEKHYHCNWTDCKQVIPHSGQSFARLEHYRIHEFSKVSIGKTKTSTTVTNPGVQRLEDESHRRRRGRPPKYPRTEIPKVPKVELSETQIAESVQSYNDGQTTEMSAIINGFKRFDTQELCPDSSCLYYAKPHFHCGRPRCHHATDRMDVLNLHAKDFHNFVNILPGFEFFDRNVNCRRPHCHNNKANRHFHCTRSKCDYSFVRHSTMSQHEKKHRLGANMGKVPPLPSTAMPTSLAGKPGSTNYIPIVPAISAAGTFDPKSKTVVKAAGTFYPISGLSIAQTSAMGKAVPLALTSLAPGSTMLAQQFSTATLASLVTTVGSPISVSMPMSISSVAGGAAGMTMPLTLLLQQKGGMALAQPSWATLRSSMHYGLEQNCGRPFCKLKKKDHYHCKECNQAFSDPVRLRIHMGKHGIKFHRSEREAEQLIQPQPVVAPVPTAMIHGLPSSLVPSEVKLDTAQAEPDQGLDLSRPKESSSASRQEMSADEDSLDKVKDESSSQDAFLTPSSSLNLNANTFSNLLAQGKLMAEEADEEEVNYADEEQEEPMDLHQNSEDSPSFASETEETNSASEMGLDLTCSSSRKRRTPDDDRSTFSETPTKNPRLSSSQISLGSLQSEDGSNGSSGKDDSVPAGYIRYRFNEDCSITPCTYRQSVTHFHCLRPDCAYGFSDRSRLVQHTLRHERIDGIMGSDFQQFRVSVSCGRDDCEFASKASHFHCLKCPFACADSSKVLAHRKYHTKLENISSHGFVKFTGALDCGSPSCSYKQKQTHYHCTYEGCSHAVLGPSQMLPHKMKHAIRDSPPVAI